jgi:hypothetical protein
MLSAIPATPALPKNSLAHHPDSPALPSFSAKHAAATRPLDGFPWPVAHQTLPKQVRRRTTWLALVGLGMLCIYVFYFSKSSTSLASIPLRSPTRGGTGAAPLAPVVGGDDGAEASVPGRQPHRSGTGSSWRKAANSKARPQITLDAAEELAALSAFLAALAENHLPQSVDPQRTIDPQLILDFDTRSDGAREELQELVRDVWARNPVVLYSKMYSSTSREIKTLLDGFRLAPAPTVIEVDQRPDASVLTPLLYRLTSAHELPILLIGGHPVGSIEEIRMLHKDGELKKLIEDAGAKIDGRKKKGGRKH